MENKSNCKTCSGTGHWLAMSPKILPCPDCNPVTDEAKRQVLTSHLNIVKEARAYGEPVTPPESWAEEFVPEPWEDGDYLVKSPDFGLMGYGDALWTCKVMNSHWAKSFISHLLSTERQRVVKIVEGMKCECSKGTECLRNRTIDDLLKTLTPKE